jgi:putative oxidoreductase
MLRTTLGTVFIAHGWRHARSLDGTARWFESIGFRQPRTQAMASGAVELASGTALVVGAATPLAASAVVGTMTVAARTVHRQNGFFVVDEGYEYVVILAAAALALAALGPGRFSVDRALNVDELVGSVPRVAVAASGVLGALVQLRLFWTRPLRPVAT